MTMKIASSSSKLRELGKPLSGNVEIGVRPNRRCESVLYMAAVFIICKK